MNNEQPVSKATFIQRFANLCLRSGLSGFPKDELDQQILLKSIVLTLDSSTTLTEKEINEKLNYWINTISQIKKFDHSTLRRRLVDEGYLTRDKDGTRYQVAQPGPHAQLFEAEVDQMDVLEVITNAREEMARRKQAFMEKAGAQTKK
jgi:hypothetical protein